MAKAHHNASTLSPDKVAELALAWAKPGASGRSVARECQVSKGTAQRYKHGPPDPASEPTVSDPVGVGEPERVMKEDAEGNAVLSLHTGKPIKTLADLIRVAEIDEGVWHVESWESSAWTVPMKIGPADNRVGIQTQQYRVKARLKRIVSRGIGDALKLVFESFKNAAPVWPKPAREKPGKGEPFMAVFGLFDVHFGKLCWKQETGENYDLAIAEVLLANAVEDLIAECAGKRVAKILLPFGNDWLHIDSRQHQTTRGTPMDVDGRFSKVLAVAIRAAVKAVEAMAAIAPVQVELVPGNHDRTLAECLCHTLAAWFRKSPDVTVGLEPRTRKYVQWGCNLIGLTHGDMVKPEKLPNLMPAEAKQEWAQTTCHEWLTGHGHRSQKWTTLDTDSQPGTVVRQLRALTRTDLWHFDYGFVSSAPTCEVYWYGRDRGYAGHAVVNARG